MYIWSFEVETKWSFHSDEDNGEIENYSVAAENFDKAWLKVQKIALAKTRAWNDTDDDGIKHKWYPVSTDLISLNRGEWLDG